MPDGYQAKPTINCLWLARAIPYPQTAGDRIYSAKLASALAGAGANVVFVGLSGAAFPDPVPGIAWEPVTAQRHSRIRALLSHYPLETARHAKNVYARHVAELLRMHKWDVLIIDHYGSGWLQKHIALAAEQVVRVFVTHNHEASVTESQWREAPPFTLKKFYLWQNWLKTRALEKKVASASDLVTAITETDAVEFAQAAPTAKIIQLTPGYDGKRLAHRVITPDTPRSIVLFGSYVWSAKQASLVLFLDQANGVMTQAGITIDVVGDIDQRFLAKMKEKYPAVHFHGFVADATSFLASARMAVLAEPVGGGFKLKLLEYIFNRVPVAALTTCAHGLPKALQAHLLLTDDLNTLLDQVVNEIDQVDLLNARQDKAFVTANNMFDWSDRGRALLNAINTMMASHAD